MFLFKRVYFSRATRKREVRKQDWEQWLHNVTTVQVPSFLVRGFYHHGHQILPYLQPQAHVERSLVRACACTRYSKILLPHFYGSRLVASQVLWNQPPPDGREEAVPQGLDHNHLLDKSYSGTSNLTCHSPRATSPEHKVLLSTADSREEKRAQHSHGTEICRVGVCTGPGLLCSVLKTIQRHVEYRPEWKVPQATTNEGQNRWLFKWPQRYPLDPRVNGDHRSSWLPCLIQPPTRPKSLCGRGV